MERRCSSSTCVDGCIPSDLGTGTSEEIEEERRLLYVAMTRAKDQLDLIVPQRFYVTSSAGGDRHMYTQRTRFIPAAILDRFAVRLWPPAGAAAGAALPGRVRGSISGRGCERGGGEHSRREPHSPCHPRESGDPVTAIGDARISTAVIAAVAKGRAARSSLIILHWRPYWVPAFAGMTGVERDEPYAIEAGRPLINQWLHLLPAIARGLKTAKALNLRGRVTVPPGALPTALEPNRTLPRNLCSGFGNRLRAMYNFAPALTAVVVILAGGKGRSHHDRSAPAMCRARSGRPRVSSTPWIGRASPIASAGR